jgi:prevent-host-death family protein
VKAAKMSNVVSALTARTQFGQIMRRASQKNERFLVDRRGQPAVIIMSVKDYIDTIAPAPTWLKEIGAEAKRKGFSKLSMRQIDAEIAAVRRERRQNALARQTR